MRCSILKYTLVLFLSNVCLSSWSQFYNGHQMEFGKNRVQYNDFFWNFVRYDEFDCYYNQFGSELADHTAEYAKKEILRIENFFDHNLENRIIFIIYNKLSDFRESNIGLVTGKTESNIGGVIKIDRNKAFIYFEGDYQKLEEQITEAIARILFNEMIYGNQFRDYATNSTLINLPEWYIDGLVAYVSKGWDIETENRVKDGILSGKYEKFNRLTGDDAKYAGHSFWRYIGEMYGKSVIPSILYLTKINKNANRGFLYVIGASLKELSYDWMGYYNNIYDMDISGKELPEQKAILKKPHKKRVYSQLKISPLGNHIAYTTNQMGQYKVWLYDINKDKHKRLLKREHKLEQITDYSYPVLAWHPSGRILTFITEEEGGIKMYYYTFGEKKLQERNILYFEKVLDYAFSSEGDLIAISAVRNGQSDIYVHNVAAGTNYQVTNDPADDLHPRFINNSKDIIFASNRLSDSLDIAASTAKRAQGKDLFIYNYANKSNTLMRLSDHQYVDKLMPLEVGQNQFLSLSNKNGTLNRYISEFDSAVSFVDTTVHYRYYANTYPQTNYSRNIIEHDYNSRTEEVGEILFRDGRYYMYKSELDPDAYYEEDLPVSPYRKQLTEQLTIRDSLQKIQYEILPIDSLFGHRLHTTDDTILFQPSPIDINNYVFEIERINYLNQELKNRKENIVIVPSLNDKKKTTRIYQKVFYQNYLVSQIDFSFLYNSYQPFTGGAVYFNPGTNIAFKLGTQDLFEDIKFSAGLRLPLNFESSEYLFSLELLKKRLDKQLIYHRQTFNNQVQDLETGSYSTVKSITNEGSAVFRYPFSQVTSVSATLGLRSDQTIYLPLLTLGTSINEQLQTPNENKLWAKIKLDYVFDNTRSLGMNLPAGTRFKVFGEAYQQVNESYANLFVLGADFRHYVVIHRNFIWASRFATSTSFGSNELIYYLGGVDNWSNWWVNKNPTFIPITEIRIKEDNHYAFQTVATNMRGFSQNIRNGNSFALINTELRWPIIRYLANHPLSNAFFENFQVVGFFDIGTAWSGLHPWSGENAYDNDVIRASTSNPSDFGAYEIIIDANREPIVAGYGFGVRSQLLGYFVRLDWAWGVENMQVLPRIFYLSLALDF